MKTRLLLFVVGLAALQVSVAGCLSVGRVSSHTFRVYTSRGGRTPDPATVQKDVETVAFGQGFRPISSPMLELATHSRLKSGIYGLEVDGDHHGKSGGGLLLITVSYTLKSTAMLIGVDGEYSVRCQQAADEFYSVFKQKYERKYGPGVIVEGIGS